MDKSRLSINRELAASEAAPDASSKVSINTSIYTSGNRIQSLCTRPLQYTNDAHLAYDRLMEDEDFEEEFELDVSANPTTCKRISRRPARNADHSLWMLIPLLSLACSGERA